MTSTKMDGHRCCSKQKIKRGLWSPEEDEKLMGYITTHGHGSWSSVPRLAGLDRCGKSCRLRWINYLRPDLKRGSFTAEEEQIIIDVHRIVGNKWAQIAKHLPGRTDNEVKNFWNSCIKKRLLSQGLDPNTHNLLSAHQRAANRAAGNISRTHKEPISVFTLSNQLTDASLEMKTPFVTIPHAQPSLLQNMAIPTTEAQSTDVVLNAQRQISTDVTGFPYRSTLDLSTSNNSSSSSSLNPSWIELPNHDNWFWGGTVEPFEVPRLEGEQSVRQLQQENKEVSSEMRPDEIGEAKDNQIMDTSFDSFNIDPGFMESALMSGLLHYDFNPMDDLAWN